MDYSLERERRCRFELQDAFSLLGIVVLLIVLTGLSVSASDGYSSGKLTDIFTTDAFTGNWEVITKMNWVGKVMSWVISAFSLIGLFTVGLKVMLTMLYLSGKNFWDNVDDIKSAGLGKSAFGMRELFNNAYNAKYGTGADALISFAFGLFPNIKNYSEYSSNAKHKNNFAETDTVASYLLKSAIPNVLTIFAFSMGFNGTLWQAYGTVVEAMGIAAQNFADTNLSNLVDRAINTGGNYSFAYNADGTKYGDFKQTVAKKVYSSLLKNTTDLSSEVKIAIGSKIDTKLSSVIDMMSYLAATATIDENGDKIVTVESTQYKVNGISYSYDNGSAYALAYAADANGDFSKNATTVTANSWSKLASDITDAQARNLSYSVVINNADSYSGAISIPATELGFAGDDSGKSLYYVHIFISKKANSDEHNYFSLSDELSGDTDSGDTGGGSGTTDQSRDQM